MAGFVMFDPKFRILAVALLAGSCAAGMILVSLLAGPGEMSPALSQTFDAFRTVFIGSTGAIIALLGSRSK